MLVKTKKLTKLLMLNSYGSISRGCIAYGIGCIESIKASMPEAEITIWSIRSKDDTLWSQYGVQVEQHPWITRHKSKLVTVFRMLSRFCFDLAVCLFSRLARRINKRSAVLYEEFDAIIDPDMDGLNDTNYGIITTLVNLLFAFLTRIVVRKPITLVPASIGPFNSLLSKTAARFVLNRENLITVRGERSKEYLKEIGVNKPEIVLAADLAFLLDPGDRDRVTEILDLEGISKAKRPLVGISPSQEMGRWSFSGYGTETEKRKKYLILMAKIADYIIEKIGASIVFVPHSVTDPYYEGLSDGSAARDIHQKTKNKQNVKIISSDYTAHEMKGIIGSFDMFLSCRMHPAVASTSMGIPTIAITYGKKFDDVIGGTMNQYERIINIERSDIDDVFERAKANVDFVWANRDKIKAELKERTIIAQERALLFGKLLKGIVEKGGNS